MNKIMTKTRVLNEIEKNSRKLKEKGVKKIGLFGSVLKNKATNRSDIDLIVNFDNVSFDNYAEVIILLEKIFRKKIDLITEASLRPELDYIKKEAEYARL
jgi:predicted nucleotidyltransferase